MKKIIALLIYLIPALAYANINNVGYWSVKCGGFGGNIEINNPDGAKININENNLYISAHLESDNDGRTKVYYRDIIESMNGSIVWANVAQNKPIAEFLVKDGVLHLAWKGFFDTNKKRYIWKAEPDFVVASGNGDIKMKKCDF